VFGRFERKSIQSSGAIQGAGGGAARAVRLLDARTTYALAVVIVVVVDCSHRRDDRRQVGMPTHQFQSNEPTHRSTRRNRALRFGSGRRLEHSAPMMTWRAAERSCEQRRKVRASDSLVR
jgi:hypothetical protein